MKLTPNFDPKKHPNPAHNPAPAKGTPDPQSADASGPNAKPTPANAAQTDEETAESEAADNAAPAADPAAADLQPDTHGDTDPGASNTGDVRPM